MSAADDAVADEVVDLAFSLAGRSVPEDYAEPLWQALAAALPWLAADEAAGVHPLARISSPAAGQCYLSKHTRLTLRLAAERVEPARALSGMRLDLGEALAVGEAKLRPLAPAKVVYSPFVAVGISDEAAFFAECRRQLAALGIEAQLVVGKAQAMRAGGVVVEGFSLMLHGLRAEHSLRLQRAGLGVQRKHGCGIFLQHRSVAAVGGD
ncbi:MAG: type I-MYXAN CRISPR-associated protein Cas6/Cmx6 [Rhodocyclaceae bacterium]|nr:type I-MYXAN CRISPR-associated protein Cas6/Cmx6 [Rhodocyclaceae bacterium]